MHKRSKTKLVNGDCLVELKKLPRNSVNLIVTSPPYADQRTSTYGGISPDKYVEWFLPIAEQLKRVLKDDGTFIINIKERVIDGERHTYVLELIQALRAQGWLWTEEFIWHKKNSHPGKWPNRFRDGWERLIQFNLDRKFTMYQDEVMVPLGDWHKSRFKNLREIDKVRDNSKVNSGFGKNVSNWVGRDFVYPDNVLHMATESSNKSHSAVYPETIPDWFIRLFTKEGDCVLDPFVGSGTTSVAALKLKRNSIGIDTMPEYIEYATQRIQKELEASNPEVKKPKTQRKQAESKPEILPVYAFSDMPLIPSIDGVA
ncbi:MAG: site-specific DNA-methyltransferase [Candidatus Saccharibacteria bacterium]|nr:site-specific DNA-methyltransferase [Candidatus Saccharibacteria bacterium]